MRAATVTLDRLPLVVSGSGGLHERLAQALGDLGAELQASIGEHPNIGSVVHVPTAEARLEDRLLVETPREEWDANAEAPIRRALRAMQLAYAALCDRGGSIVLVVPSIAQTGCPGLAPFASAAEGIRLMGKSAARAWGGRHIRVNNVTAPIELWGVRQASDHAVPSKFGPSLPPRDLIADLAGIIAFLCSPLSEGVTGATIGVDRGTLLAP